MHPAGRALIGLWAAFALLAGGGAVVLWRLGPPPPARQIAPVPARTAASTAAPIAAPASSTTRQGATSSATGPSAGHATGPAPVVATAPNGPVAVLPDRGVIAVAPPVPALSEPAPDFPDRTLPVIGADGQTPAKVYAARTGLPASGPQVAILLEGLGLSDTLDHDAVDTLPAAVSFAVSPYADALDRSADAPLLQQARRNGHELWLSLPMEPAGSSADTEGTQALSSGIDLAQDRKALQWSLSRFAGYVGVTNALGGLRGDRFASGSDFAMVASALERRGLLYVDAGLAPHEQPAIDPPGTRHADLSIDESPDAADIQARLSRLEQLAQTNGSALGVAGPLRPATLDRLRGWARGLRDRGVTLVAVSALPAPHPPPPPSGDQFADPRPATGPAGQPPAVAVPSPPGAGAGPAAIGQPETRTTPGAGPGTAPGATPAAASGANPRPHPGMNQEPSPQ